MANLTLSDMMDMQKELWEKNKEKWPEMTPSHARTSMLWMMAEMGEAAQIMKKRGEDDIMKDEFLREEFVTELTDILMYFSNFCMCFSITPEELSNAYIQKHNKNLDRDFYNERRNYLRQTK